MSVLLHLFHGRKDPDAELDDWGDNGPVLGPCKWVHTTYSTDVKFELVGADDDAAALHVVNDMLYYAGVWYGDWSVFDAAADAAKGITITPFAREQSFPPGTVCFKRKASELVAYPTIAWTRGSAEAEEYRRNTAVKMAAAADVPICTSCYAAKGSARVDRGLACGTHCDPCFEQMIRACRQRSW